MSAEDQTSVILESGDGFQFIVRKSAASKSPAIRSMLDKKNAFVEAVENRIVFKNITAPVLEKVCQYFYYYEKYKGQEYCPDPDFITPELALELLCVADFLDC
ncbi:BTB/POZ protein [Pyronema omphalodes]|nr:BTB/POZ protein [Pyronema omphalodes]